MKYYLATSLGNIEAAKKAHERLAKRGWECTYDWTVHGSLAAKPERWEEVAQKEIHGVVGADVLIALMPGGRGTHVEIGAALAYGIHVWIVGLDEKAAYECLFHHHPQARRFKAFSEVEAYIDMLQAEAPRGV